MWRLESWRVCRFGPPCIERGPRELGSTDHIERYLGRHGEKLPGWCKWTEPSSELCLVVAIPVHREVKTLFGVLDSLQETGMPREWVEIFVCVNDSRNDGPSVHEENQETLRLLEVYDSFFPLRVLDCSGPTRGFAAKKGGVGRARRLVMDLGLRWLAKTKVRGRGMLVSLDGDSPVGKNYLKDLWEEMNEREALLGISNYEHPLPEEAAHREALIAYEGWMRYFALGLRQAGSPYGVETLGSTLAVRGELYAQADGIPRKSALEDFYFLQKVIKYTGGVGVERLSRPMVYPSPRLSDRVPRGTGPALRQAVEKGECLQVPDPEVFRGIAEFHRGLEPYFRGSKGNEEGLGIMSGWLKEEGYLQGLGELRERANSLETFRLGAIRHIDGLKERKWVNSMREKLPDLRLSLATQKLFGLPEELKSEATLNLLRELASS